MIAIAENTTVHENGCVIVQRPELKPGALVKVILLLEDQPESPAAIPPGRPGSFFEAIGNLKLEGPSDFSEHLDGYLYHGKSHDRE